MEEPGSEFFRKTKALINRISENKCEFSLSQRVQCTAFKVTELKLKNSLPDPDDEFMPFLKIIKEKFNKVFVAHNKEIEEAIQEKTDLECLKNEDYNKIKAPNEKWENQLSGLMEALPGKLNTMLKDTKYRVDSENASLFEKIPANDDIVENRNCRKKDSLDRKTEQITTKTNNVIQIAKIEIDRLNKYSEEKLKILNTFVEALQTNKQNYDLEIQKAHKEIEDAKIDRLKVIDDRIKTLQAKHSKSDEEYGSWVQHYGGKERVDSFNPAEVGQTSTKSCHTEDRDTCNKNFNCQWEQDSCHDEEEGEDDFVQAQEDEAVTTPLPHTVPPAVPTAAVPTAVPPAVTGSNPKVDKEITLKAASTLSVVPKIEDLKSIIMQSEDGNFISDINTAIAACMKYDTNPHKTSLELIDTFTNTEDITIFIDAIKAIRLPPEVTKVRTQLDISADMIMASCKEQKSFFGYYNEEQLIACYEQANNLARLYLYFRLITITTEQFQKIEGFKNTQAKGVVITSTTIQNFLAKASSAWMANYLERFETVSKIIEEINSQLLAGIVVILP